jgi:hypothetical protein
MRPPRDDPSALLDNDRGVTINDSIAAGTLIAVTLVLAAGLGTAILFADRSGGGPPSANFTFEHFSDSSLLIVTMSRGDPIPAGEIRLRSDRANATWAEVANASNGTMVKEGDTVQLSEGSAFGSPVRSTDTVRVEWTGGNETKLLDEWPVSEDQ